MAVRTLRRFPILDQGAQHRYGRKDYAGASTQLKHIDADGQEDDDAEREANQCPESQAR